MERMSLELFFCQYARQASVDQSVKCLEKKKKWEKKEQMFFKYICTTHFEVSWERWLKCFVKKSHKNCPFSPFFERLKTLLDVAALGS